MGNRFIGAIWFKFLPTDSKNSLSLCPLSSEYIFLNSYISLAYFSLHGDVYN